jgi:hypothetical protein
MAPLLVEFGRSRIERRALSLTRADKDRILQNFPEKIAVSVTGFGPQEYPLRPHVKAFLDAIQPPSVKITFEVEGGSEDPELTLIEDVQLKVLGVSTGEFAVGETSVSYRFTADLERDTLKMNPCKSQDGREGVQPARQFRLVWDIEIEITPGVGGLFEVDESEIVIVAPNCFPPEPVIDEEVADGDEDETAAARDKKKKKHKRH